MGGAQRQLIRIAEELKSTRVKITVLSAQVKNCVAQEEVSENFIIKRLPTTTIPGLSMFLFMLLLPLALFIQHIRYRFNLIYLPLPDIFIIDLLMIRAILRIPVIARIAATELDLKYYHDSWLSIKLLIKSSILRMDAVQVLNPETFKRALDEGRTNQNTYLIANGVVIPNQQRAYPKLTNEIIYVGAMRHRPERLTIEQKNLVFLIDAIEQFLEDYPEHRLVMIGDGNYRAHLERYVQSKGLQNNIHFLGYKTEVWSYLLYSDIFVNASHFEGMPNTVLEAMAAGVFVLCSDIPEHRFIIGNNEYGELFDKSDVKDLTSKLIRFYNNPERFIEKAHKGRELIQRRFSMEKISESVLSMFSKVIARFNKG